MNDRTSGSTANRPLEPLTPMVSYAQNFEDVILRRALQDVARGFYIDIGAFHPQVDSVTRWFYGQGWTGINIEPNPKFFSLLQNERPHDINLPFAVTDHEGIAQLRLLDGLSTIMDDVARLYDHDGQDLPEVAEIKSVTLDYVFDHYASGKTVDFLKVDAEGAEAIILNACKFDSCRPRILVVEATQPNSIVSTAESWEPALLKKGYSFAYFDQLNRFYVRNEDNWRATYFKSPPNIFDRFLLDVTDARVDLAGTLGRLEPGFPVGGVPGLLAQRDDLATRLNQSIQEVQRVEARSREIETAGQRSMLIAQQSQSELQLMREVAEQAADKIKAAEEAKKAAEESAKTAKAAAKLAEVRLHNFLTHEAPALRCHAEQAQVLASSLSKKNDLYMLEIANLNLRINKLVADNSKIENLLKISYAENAHLRLDFKQSIYERDTAYSIISELKASNSWRMTAPIRAISMGFKRK